MPNFLQTELIGARVSPSFKRFVRVEAAKRDLTMSAIIVKALEFFLSQTQSPNIENISITTDNDSKEHQ